jgi:hypothetical protein
MNRFHKWLRTADGLAVGQQLPRPRSMFQLILHAVIARRGPMTSARAVPPYAAGVASALPAGAAVGTIIARPSV